MQARPPDRQKARELRREGVTYRQIAAQLEVAVNTAYRWTRDIELTEIQRQRNRLGPTATQNPAVVAQRAQTWSQRCRAQRAAYQEEGRARARAGHDALHLQGCMLYWAEGTKGRNVVDFTNSDVAMVIVFLRFLRESLEVSDDRVKLALNVYTNNGLSIDEIEAHWLRVLSLSCACVRKHTLNNTPASSSGSRPNRLVYGVCSLRVGSTRALQHIYGAIQEYGGFEEPRWIG